MNYEFMDYFFMEWLILEKKFDEAGLEGLSEEEIVILKSEWSESAKRKLMLKL